LLHYLSKFASTFYSNKVITKPRTCTCNEVRFSAIFTTFTSLLSQWSNSVTGNWESQTDGRHNCFTTANLKPC